MTGDPRPDLVWSSTEGKRQQAWVSERSQHSGAEGAQQQTVAGEKLGWQRALLGRNPVVAATEGHGSDLADVVEVERLPAGEPDLDLLATRLVDAKQAGRDRCGRRWPPRGLRAGGSRRCLPDPRAVAHPWRPRPAVSRRGDAGRARLPVSRRSLVAGRGDELKELARRVARLLERRCVGAKCKCRVSAI